MINTQRDRVYAERRRALLSSTLDQQMVEYAERTCDDILEASISVKADTVFPASMMGTCRRSMLRAPQRLREQTVPAFV